MWTEEGPSMTEDDGGGCQALTTWVMEVLTLQRDAELSDEISGLGCVDGVGGGGGEGHTHMRRYDEAK